MAPVKAPLPTLPQPPQPALFQIQPSPSSALRREYEPGCQPEWVYERYLPTWRWKMRKYLVQRLEREKDWMADWQKRVRTEGRDKFFYWTAVFGTHTFFVIFLPMLFLLGYPKEGRGLLHVVGLGIYTSSFAKDLVCTPRPYSPPVVRLSMSTHAHEYGFPSSHSTNSVSVAIYIGEMLFRARLSQTLSTSGLLLGWTLLLVYVASVVGGRIYTGMHSTADVIGGSLMGVFCCLFWTAIGSATEAWVDTGTILVPVLGIPLTLFLVHFHPEPVEDCPCFEDAIAILAVVLGTFMGHWHGAYIGVSVLSAFQRSLTDRGLAEGAFVAVLRVVVGIGIILLWRLAAKAILLTILPPIFRVSSLLFDFELPTRKHYTAATDYSQVPLKPVRTMPSFVDLPEFHKKGRLIQRSPLARDAASSSSTDATPDDSDDTASPIDGVNGPPEQRSNSLSVPIVGRYGSNGHAVTKRQRNVVSKRGDHSAKKEDLDQHGKGRKRTNREPPKYDAQVLTKVVVYWGIGFLCGAILPRVFYVIETALSL